MKYGSSAEIGPSQSAFNAFVKVANRVDAILEAALARNTLAALDYKLLYVPVLMPTEWQHNYPERSRLRKKARTFDCSPQLDYSVFLNGRFEDQVYEYFRGLKTAVRRLPDMGANSEQVTEFKRVLAIAGQQALELGPADSPQAQILDPPEMDMITTLNVVEMDDCDGVASVAEVVRAVERLDGKDHDMVMLVGAENVQMTIGGGNDGCVMVHLWRKNGLQALAGDGPADTTVELSIGGASRAHPANSVVPLSTAITAATWFTQHGSVDPNATWIEWPVG